MPSSLPEHVESALRDAESDYSTTTIQSLRAAWRDLLEWWTGERDLASWETATEDGDLPPPPAIAQYLNERRSLALSTLSGRRQAIKVVYGHHDQAPFEHPEVQETWAEVRQQKKEASGTSRDGSDYDRIAVIENSLSVLAEHFSARGQEGGSKRKLRVDETKYLPKEVSTGEDMSDDQRRLIPEPTFRPKTLRNRALLLLVATTTTTRSQITRIRVEDIHLREPGTSPREDGVVAARDAPLQITFRNNEGEPEAVLYLKVESELRFCPARAVASWIVRVGLQEGQLFRSLTPQGKPKASGIQPQAINHVIRRRAREVDGLDSSEWTTRKLRSV